MKRLIVSLSIAATLTLSSGREARADIFGGDVVVLTQILAQTIQQLAQLRQIFETGTRQIDLINEINRGINDSMNLIRTINPNADPGIFREWQRTSDAIRAVRDLYGAIVSSKDERIQQSADQSVAEAVTMNNSIYDYTRQIDEIGEAIKSYSHSVSPGGAQKLTAESMGVMLHVMNTSLRAQATSLKLQAQVLAMQNHKDKEATRETAEASDSLKTSIEKQTPKFEYPRF